VTVLALDFETRWGAPFGGSNVYSLTHMTTEAYVRDWRFRAHGAAVSIDGEPDWWCTHDRLPALFASLDPSKTVMVCHHAQFDGLIASHHYGFIAAAYICTQQAARMLALPGSLANLSKHFGLPPKMKDLALSKGLAELPPWVEERIGPYSCHDNWLCQQNLKRMKTMLPAAEWVTISNVTKMFVRPLMHINTAPLIARIDEIETKRLALQLEAGLSRDQLMSNQQLGQFFLREGLDWGNQSMAKSNPDFLELQEHPNDRIALAVSARLGVKGTMEQSRAQTFVDMASRGAACVYLNCGGAGTTRLSGGDKTNYQNLKRGSVLRTAHEAREGHELIIVDSSQIEARILDTLADQHDAIAAWHRGEDQYSKIAMELHPGVQIAKGNPLRNDGKVLKLAPGYGMGAATYQRQLSVGLMGNPPVQVSMQRAEEMIAIYRNRHPKVKVLWYKANDWIEMMAEGRSLDWKMLQIRPGKILLPNGLELRYPHLHQTPDGWTYQSQHGSYYKLWGGTLVQNICEALARDVVIPQCNHIARELPWLSSTHDEGVFEAPAEVADEVTQWAEDVFRTVLPEWAKGWPIDAEADHSFNYSK